MSYYEKHRSRGSIKYLVPFFCSCHDNEFKAMDNTDKNYKNTRFHDCKVDKGIPDLVKHDQKKLKDVKAHKTF